MQAITRGNVKIIVTEDPGEMGRQTAGLVAEEMKKNETLVLGLCTGGTAVPIYQELISMYMERTLSFRNATTFNLDEYYPIHPRETSSYYCFMRTELFDYIDITSSNILFPNALSRNPSQACESYESLIQKCGGIDLMLLGIGENAHIGFNEPGTPRTSRTRMVALTEKTRASNSRFFDVLDQVPSHALSMGIATIMDARKIVLSACGAKKAKAIADALEAISTPEVPASYLQEHPDCTFVLDREAALYLL